MEFNSFELDDSIESMVICILLRRAVRSRRFVVNVVLEDADGQSVDVEKWPVYRRLGNPAKSVRFGEAGELVTMTSVSNTVGNGVLKVAVTDKKGANVNVGELAVLMTLKKASASFLVRSSNA